MKSMNKVQLVGYLGCNPEIITLKNGELLARISMATDYWFHEPNAEPKKFTDWHTVKIWGKLHVEKLKGNLITGSHILVDGRIVYRTYTDQEGRKRYFTEIRANYLVDLDR